MKAQANQIRPGWVIEDEGKQWSVIKIQLIQPGKGGAFIQVEMRDISNGIKKNTRWRTADTIEKLMSEEKDCQFLYREGDSLYFMTKEEYDQFNLSADVLGEQLPFLQDNMDVTVNFIEGKPISVNLPAQVILTVAETEPYIKGQTATTSYKPAIMDNGVRVMIPPFVATGEKIVVATADSTYVERAK